MQKKNIKYGAEIYENLRKIWTNIKFGVKKTHFIIFKFTDSEMATPAGQSEEVHLIVLMNKDCII